MARRRRRRRFPTAPALITLCAAGGLCAWWLITGPADRGELDPTLALAPQAALTTDRPEVLPDTLPRPGIMEKGTDSPTDGSTTAGPATGTSKVDASQRAASLIAAGKRALSEGDAITARAHFSEAVPLVPQGTDAVFLRAELTRIGTETIFSPRLFDNDPHVTRYVIKTGDTLAKIASANKVSSDLLADINAIRNKNLIRAGQSLKIIKGPFRAVIDRKSFALEVYLGSTFVRHYRVGLGANGSTPAGEWRVATKLLNPTYYPPRGGRIMSGDDPENPLGERWIGLQGVVGEAVGQLRYGIHGTIEPESIGQNASLGCVRMYNEDVEALYTYLVERHSTVTIN